MTPFDAAKILGLSGNITPEIAKDAYRNACKKYHPDINPAGEEMMKLVNSAYSILQNFNSDVKEQETEYGEQLNNALNAIINLSGLLIEICGAWVWVSGSTKDHKEALKDAGYKWASKKKSWYFRPTQYRSHARGQSSMEEIRAKYGTTKPQNSPRNRLSASR